MYQRWKCIDLDDFGHLKNAYMYAVLIQTTLGTLSPAKTILSLLPTKSVISISPALLIRISSMRS